MKYVLETDRLLLRPLEETDVQPMYDIICSHPDMNYFMPWDTPEDISETKGFFVARQDEQERGGAAVWGIFMQNNLIGIISLDDIIRMRMGWRVDTAELGYWLNPDLHGKGIMTEAAKAVLEYGFLHLGLHRISVSHIAQNNASAKVIEKLGFRKVGDLKNYYFFDGKWWDNCNYEIIIDDWKKIYS